VRDYWFSLLFSVGVCLKTLVPNADWPTCRLDAAYCALYEAISIVLDYTDGHVGEGFEAYTNVNVIMAGRAAKGLRALLACDLGGNSAWWRHEMVPKALCLSAVSATIYWTLINYKEVSSAAFKSTPSSLGVNNGATYLAFHLH
jgi:hypothetical protein